jgi:cytochrome c
MAAAARTVILAAVLWGTATAALAQDGATLFRQQCSACHRPDGGRGLGPDLRGVTGRTAASLPEFRYSTALRESGLTWDDETLRRFLAAPRATVPGTAMVYVGLRDPERLEAIIAYLHSLPAR